MTDSGFLTIHQSDSWTEAALAEVQAIFDVHNELVDLVNDSCSNDFYEVICSYDFAGKGFEYAKNAIRMAVEDSYCRYTTVISGSKTKHLTITNTEAFNIDVVSSLVQVIATKYNVPVTEAAEAQKYWDDSYSCGGMNAWVWAGHTAVKDSCSKGGEYWLLANMVATELKHASEVLDTIVNMEHMMPGMWVGATPQQRESIKACAAQLVDLSAKLNTIMNSF